MLNYREIPFMFTYAVATKRWRDTSPALIFACTDKAQQEEFEDVVTVYELAKHPLVKSIMGNTYFVRFISKSNDTPKWIFHLDIQQVLTGIDARDHTKILLKIKDKSLGEISTKQILAECYLPQKYSMSCNECITKVHTPEQAASKHNCILKQMIPFAGTHYDRNPVINNGIYVKDLAEDFGLKHGKTKINEFVYISPVMTGRPGILQKIRPIEDHFFDRVQEAANCRAGAQRERKRYSDFRKEVCSTCGVHKTCENNFDDRSRRFCKGPYPKNQKEIIQKIVQNTRNPFTVPQLRYLLANSGILPKRYNRFIVAATLTMYNNQLCFAIRRKTKPHAYDNILYTSDFREARTLIQKYGNDFNGKNIAPLTQERLAILYEAANRDYSPTYRNNWRTTSYPVLYIESDGKSFRVNYSYHGRGLCWFDMELNSIQDIYLNFECFTFLSKEYHSLRKY